MKLEVGMLCKHFKGKDLIEKNIYRIEKIGIKGKEIDTNTITYTGEGILENSINLVVYSSIFQEGKTFAREYDDLIFELDEEKKKIYMQNQRVTPLTNDEINEIQKEEFINKKMEYLNSKYSKKI